MYIIGALTTINIQQTVAFSAYLILCLYLSPGIAECGRLHIVQAVRLASKLDHVLLSVIVVIIFLTRCRPLKPYNDELHLEPKSQPSAGNSLIKSEPSYIFF